MTGESGNNGLERRRVASPIRKNKKRDRPTDHRPEFGMEQSIRKLRPDLGASVNLMLAFALVAACSVNALLLYVHL
jgi:hypothetical protein